MAGRSSSRSTRAATLLRAPCGTSWRSSAWTPRSSGSCSEPAAGASVQDSCAVSEPAILPFRQRCRPRTAGSPAGSQVGYPGHPTNPPECTRPAEALRDHRKSRRPSRDRGSGTAGRHSRCRWFRAQRPGAHLLRSDGDPVRRLQPRFHGDFGRAGQAVRAHQVTGREDRWVARIVRAALTAVCQLCSS
jgi:hypothetical protein